MEFKDLWNVESAMQVLTHETVDAKVWAEAVKWLILYGPVEIRQLLLEASTIATSTSFPDLKPSGYTDDGQPCYDMRDLARSLGTTVTEVAKLLEQKETEFSSLHVFGNSGHETIH
jgi:hypothetical protein